MAATKGIRAGKAYVELFADNSKLVRGLKQASAKLKAFGAGVGQIGMGMAKLGAVALGGFAAAAKSFASMGDELGKMSKRTGFSVEALSELSHVAQIGGTSIQDMEVGFRRMQRTLYDAERGLSTATDALSDLGMTADDLKGMKPEEQFILLADAMSKVQDDTKRAGIAMSIFGRNGTALFPMIEGGAASIEKLRKEARDLGLVISTEAATAAEEFTDSMTRLWSVIKRTVFSVGASLAPAMDSLTKSLTDTMGGVSKWIQQNSELIITIAKVAVGVTAAGVALLVIGKTISGVGMILKAVTVVVGILSSPVLLVVGALGALAAALAWVGLSGDSFAAKMQTLKNMVMPAVQATVGFIRNAWQGLSAILAPIMAGIAESIKGAWTQVVAFVTPIVSAFVKFVMTAFDAMWKFLSPIITGIRDALVAAWEFVAPYIAPVLNWLQKAVILSFAAISFAIENWKALLEYSLVAAAYGIIKFANQAEHFFTVAIPAYLDWFCKNWRDIFQSIWNGIKTFAKNVWENLKNLWNSIKGLFKGEGWEFQWTGLLEGFESTIKEMPKIAERQIGPLEKQLADHMNRLGEQLGRDWEKKKKEFMPDELKAPGAKPKPPTRPGAVPDVAAKLDEAANNLKDVGEGLGKTEEKLTVRGTFNAAAMLGLQAGGADDRIANATEKTAAEIVGMRRDVRNNRAAFD